MYKLPPSFPTNQSNRPTKLFVTKMFSGRGRELFVCTLKKQCLSTSRRPRKPWWFLCEYVIVHTIWGGSPVILWISLGGKPKWLPLKFGYHDVMRTSPIVCFYNILMVESLRHFFLSSKRWKNKDFTWKKILSRSFFCPPRILLCFIFFFLFVSFFFFGKLWANRFLFANLFVCNLQTALKKTRRCLQEYEVRHFLRQVGKDEAGRIACTFFGRYIYRTV